MVVRSSGKEDPAVQAIRDRCEWGGTSDVLASVELVERAANCPGIERGIVRKTENCEESVLSERRGGGGDSLISGAR